MADKLETQQSSPATGTSTAEHPINNDDKAESSLATAPDASPSSPPSSARTVALLKKKANLEQKLADLEAELASHVAETKLPSGLEVPSSWTTEQKTAQAIEGANATVKEHIELLHRYNAIKDVGLGLLGLLAEQRGMRQVVLMEEFGLTAKD
jgi:hypothetical protein